MELKIIIWIIIGIIYLVSRSRKKQEPPVQSPEVEHENPSQPVTFEELLKEIQTAKKKPEPRPIAQYTSYEEKPEREEKILEDTDYNYRDHDKIYEIYEKAKQEAFHRP